MAGNFNLSVETDAPMSMETFLQVKYVCERMMPIVVSFGIVGNILSLVVLTRKEMTSVPVLFLRALSACNLCEQIVRIPYFLDLNQSVMIMDNLFTFHRVYRIIQYGPVNYFAISSNWIITAVTIERFLSLNVISGGSKFICTPLRAKITIGAIFLASFALNILKFREFAANPDPDTKPSHRLTALGGNTHFIYGSHIVLDTLLPILILVVFNFLLLCLFIKHLRRVAQSGWMSCVDIMNVTTLVMSKGTLFILFHAVQVYVAVDILILGQAHIRHSLYFRALCLISNLLVATNTSCNFMLYYVILQKFRNTFKRIFTWQPVKVENSKSARASSSKTQTESFHQEGPVDFYPR